MGKAGFQTWMNVDANILWPIVTALTVGLILIIRFFRNDTRGSATSRSCTGGIAVSKPGPDQTLELIRSRRSIFPKDFNGERLTDTELGLLLEAGNWAPTHGKTEPWRYVSISGHAALTRYLGFLDTWYTDRAHLFSEDVLEKFRKKLDGLITLWPEKVSHLLLIVMKRQSLPEKRMPEWEEMCAVAMSVQNMHLQATSMRDIAAFWSSHTWCKDARESKELKLNFGFEEEDKVMGAFVVGKYDSGSKKFKSVRGSVERKVHFRREDF